MSSNGRWRQLARHRTAFFRIADRESLIVAALLSATLLIGLCTAWRYGVSIDEFNTDDYGPKALAWYTSGFTDRSHFETVEFSLWYYGPWFHIATSLIQSIGLGDRFAVRHAMTFLVGWAGIAAVFPIGRLAAGQWAGLAAIVLLLGTGYVYGSLFFTTIDVPFLAAMTWATLAIVVAGQKAMPSWRNVIVAGLFIGLAIGTRTGGVVALAYLALAMMLSAGECRFRQGGLSRQYLIGLVFRYLTACATAAAVAIAIWPWLQIGNPLRQFAIAFGHFGAIPMSYEFSHWGKRVRTDALPLAYIPEQLAARLPEAFLLLLVIATISGVIFALRLAHDFVGRSANPNAPVLTVGLSRRLRALLVVLVAAVAPIALIMIQHVTIYDGIRHLLFVIPMLGVIAGAAFAAVLPLLWRLGVLFPLLLGVYGAGTLLNLVRLHPLEYVSMNLFAGGTSGAYGRFEMDYSSVAASEAIRQLERRLGYGRGAATAAAPLRVMVCIPWRESAVTPLLPSGWMAETDLGIADYVIETERWRCAQAHQAPPFQLIDEVRRADRTFAWIYARTDNPQR